MARYGQASRAKRGSDEDLGGVIAQGEGVALRVVAVVSAYNAEITERLFEGAAAQFAASAPKGSVLTRVDAPGSFELPTLALAAAVTQRFDGAVALGCLIKGETVHDRVIADAVARGLIDVTLRTGMPVAFGVITAETESQAKARAGMSGRGFKAVGNKGAEAMGALLATLAAVDGLHEASRLEEERGTPSRAVGGQVSTKAKAKVKVGAKAGAKAAGGSTR
jgi:6,7-dimethyl-8-ribityllumazine synthase